MEDEQDRIGKNLLKEFDANLEFSDSEEFDLKESKKGRNIKQIMILKIFFMKY
jgi:hypothetical protein